MGLGSLVARLALNTREYEEGVRRAEGLGRRFSRNMERDVGKRLNQVFGLGGIFAAGHALRRFTFEASAELQSLAQANDITIAQLLEIQAHANKSGQSFEEFAKSVKSAGSSLKEFAAQNVTPGTGAILGEDAAGSINQARTSASGFGDMLKFAGQAVLGNALDFYRGLFGGDASMFERLSQSAGKPISRRFDTGRATGELFGPDLPPDERLPGFELSRRTFGPSANALQQIGAFSAVDQTTVEVRTAVTVLRSIDGTLKKVATANTDNLTLSP